MAAKLPTILDCSWDCRRIRRGVRTVDRNGSYKSLEPLVYLDLRLCGYHHRESIFDHPSDRRVVSSASGLFLQKRLIPEQISNPALFDDITA
jgi:hypothetical protein